jgi:hypothetical protein
MTMHNHWERRLAEARKINDQIKAELEVALACAGRDAAEPQRAVVGGGLAASATRPRHRAATRSAGRPERRSGDGDRRRASAPEATSTA